MPLSRLKQLLPCPTCQYDLQGLASVDAIVRCPECGAVTTHAKILSEKKRHEERRKIWTVAAIVVLFMAAIFLLLRRLGTVTVPDGATFLPGLFFGLFLFIHSFIVLEAPLRARLALGFIGGLAGGLLSHRFENTVLDACSLDIVLFVLVVGWIIFAHRYGWIAPAYRQSQKHNIDSIDRPRIESTDPTARPSARSSAAHRGSREGR